MMTNSRALFHGLTLAVIALGAAGCAQVQPTPIPIYSERVTVHAATVTQPMQGMVRTKPSQEFFLWTGSSDGFPSTGKTIDSLADVRWLIPPPPPPQPPPSAPLSQAPAPVAPPPVDTDVAFSIPFASGSAELSDSARQLLRLALGQNVVRVRAITGHTDSQGGASSNETLSSRRAAAVAAFIKTLNPDLPMLGEPQAKGESSPVQDNTTEEGRALNRRADVSATTRSRN